MVFEQIFKERWIEKKPRHAFLLGVVYSAIGLLSSWFIFKSSFGLMSIAFTSILLIPSLNKLLAHEENVEIRERKFHLMQLLKDHKDIFEIYVFLFLGVFVAYSAFVLMLPPETALRLFAPQLKVAGITGYAFFQTMFGSILLNNLIVMVVCFVLSLIYGAGSILFITWNATVWGVVFAYNAKVSASYMGSHPWVAFGAMMLPILPHMITEALSYLSAAIAGGVVSKSVIREKWGSKKFNHVLTDGLILLGIGFILVVIAGWLEVYVFPLLL